MEVPCVHEDARVYMSDGTTKPAKEVRMGDVVFTGVGKEGHLKNQVMCVLKFLCPDNTASFVSIPTDTGNLRVSACQPVMHPQEKRWVFPAVMAGQQPQLVACGAVYGFILEFNHINSVLINGVACLALGHNITNDPVAAHPFFGSDQLVRRLVRVPGFDIGLVTFRPGCLLYEQAETTETAGQPQPGRRVCGFDSSKAVVAAPAFSGRTFGHGER